MKSLDKMKGINVEKLAKAIEADAGHPLPNLRTALAEVKAGAFGAIHTPKSIAARKPGRPAGSVKLEPKVSTTIRFDQDVIEALRASGKGWQTRVNDLIRADIKAGRLKSLT